MGPSFNLQGGYNFLNLETGKTIKQRDFDELPMPNWVIKRVEELAEKDSEDRNIIVEDRNQQPMGDLDENETAPDDGYLTG
eukprot:3551035-Ditylum_brightwellii.AAC.1